MPEPTPSVDKLESRRSNWRRYYAKDPQKHRDRTKLWRLKNRLKNPNYNKERWLEYKVKRLKEDPEWDSKRGKIYRVANADKVKSKDRIRRRELLAIWCENDPLPTQKGKNIVLDKQRGWLGEQIGLEWLRREGFVNILHLSSLWQPFPFDFIAEKDSQKFLIDVTINIMKTISPLKVALAKALGAKGLILFVRPCGDFGYLASMEDNKKNTVVPFTVITQFRRAKIAST